jgi:hypothetical protein
MVSRTKTCATAWTGQSTKPSFGPDEVLTVDTGKLTLGPLPVALGQPGLIPPLSPTGCLS